MRYLMLHLMSSWERFWKKIINIWKCSKKDFYKKYSKRYFDNFKDSTQHKTDRVEIDLGEFKHFTEQSIMMLGQVFNNIRYNRRLSVLNALMKEDKSSKQVLKEKSSIFSESHKELFGQNVGEDWCTNLQTKQKYQEVLHEETNSTPTSFSRNRSPFRENPPASSYGRGGGLRAPQAYFVRTMPQMQRQHGKSKKISLPQHSATSGCRRVKSRSFGQKLSPCQSDTGSNGRKTKFLFRKLGKVNSRCEYFVHCA